MRTYHEECLGILVQSKWRLQVYLVLVFDCHVWWTSINTKMMQQTEQDKATNDANCDTSRRFSCPKAFFVEAERVIDWVGAFHMIVCRGAFLVMLSLNLLSENFHCYRCWFSQLMWFIDFFSRVQCSARLATKRELKTGKNQLTSFDWSPDMC